MPQRKTRIECPQCRYKFLLTRRVQPDIALPPSPRILTQLTKPTIAYIEAVILDVLRMRQWIQTGFRHGLMPAPQLLPQRFGDLPPEPQIAVYRLHDIVAGCPIEPYPQHVNNEPVHANRIGQLLQVLNIQAPIRNRWGRIVYIDPANIAPDEQIAANLNTEVFRIQIGRDILNGAVNGEPTIRHKPDLTSYPYPLVSPASRYYRKEDHAAQGIEPRAGILSEKFLRHSTPTPKKITVAPVISSTPTTPLDSQSPQPLGSQA